MHCLPCSHTNDIIDLLPLQLSKGWSGWTVVLGNWVLGQPTKLIWVIARQGPALLAVWIFFFSYLRFLFFFSLSLGDGLIQTKVLSQMAVKPQKFNHHIDIKVMSSRYHSAKVLSSTVVVS